ncbi:uncharacterized protein LOC118220133 isoform X1 [Anguilla anguilla]|uniref:uncharacterized protein LOC118220133 isoform X1 n=2 Tax=Anguilla anguilla TaxID=7936 RepID=UPI0015AF0A2A|nr:uncharacterized protein LOC118220133 isoform X1 [Anguilla anguilla]
MFKKLTRILLEEVDNSGELKSISSVYESMRLDVLSVLKIVESKKFFIFKTESYRPTGFKLQDLLQGMDTVDFGGCHQDSIATVDIKQKWEGNAGMKSTSSIPKTEINCQVDITGSTTEIKLESMSMSRSKLQNSKIDERHILFKDMKENKKILGLGVVYEVMKNKNPMILEQTTKGEGSAKILVINVASMEAGGKVECKQQLKLDAGCVLGFKVHPLYLKTTKERTAKQFMCSDGMPELEESVADDFPRLKWRVEAELRDFGDMDQSARKLIWVSLYKTLKSPQDLYELGCMLEEGIFTGSVSRSVQDLLQLLGLDSVESSDAHDLVKPIGFLVSALSELNEEVVTLILDLDDEVRGQVLELVEGVLEQVCSLDDGVPQKSGQFSENTMRMATQVLASCGLKLAGDSLDPSLGFPGHPDVTLLALYILLKGLDKLLGP